MDSKILVAIDDGPSVSNVMGQAIGMAARACSALRFVRVMNPFAHLTGFESHTAHSAHTLPRLRKQRRLLLDADVLQGVPPRQPDPETYYPTRRRTARPGSRMKIRLAPLFVTIALAGPATAAPPAEPAAPAPAQPAAVPEAKDAARASDHASRVALERVRNALARAEQFSRDTSRQAAERIRDDVRTAERAAEGAREKSSEALRKAAERSAGASRKADEATAAALEQVRNALKEADAAVTETAARAEERAAAAAERTRIELRKAERAARNAAWLADIAFDYMAGELKDKLRPRPVVTPRDKRNPAEDGDAASPGTKPQPAQESPKKEAPRP